MISDMNVENKKESKKSISLRMNLKTSVQKLIFIHIQTHNYWA